MIIPVDTQDAATQSKQMEEILPARLTEVISTNEASGTAELHAIDFYNLRSVDNTAKARKKQQQRAREERIRNRRLRKQREIREAEETVERALKIREELHREALKSEEEMKGKEDLCYYTPRWRKAVPIAEVINPLPDFEWVPYESNDEFGRVSELKRTSWRVEEFTLELARCTVGLESFAGKKQLFSCSGTIVEFLTGIGYVVTSASLVRWPHEDKQADELKINVYLPSGETLEGTVSNVDFFYNICVVEVPSTLQMPTKSFSSDTRIFNFYERRSRDVVALGQLCKPWSLNVALGKLIPRRSQFDCEELLVSSCRISKKITV
uniref:Uncharacterized protein n=1 Tax=Avena sativa TaxID=4498 RepID=A0ACD5XW45_AVESA